MIKPDYTLTDAQFDDIINEPKQDIGGLSSTDLTFYLSKEGDLPHYRYMNPERMRYLFDRFSKAGWITGAQENQIDKALKDLT